MSTRNLDTSWCVGKRLIEIGGSFVPLTGAGTVAASTVKGFGFGYAPVNGVMTLKGTTGGNSPVPKSTPGIVRSTTGTYTITFEDPYQDVEYAWAQLAGPSGAVATGGSSLTAVVVDPFSANLNTAFTAPTMTITIVNNAGTVVESVGSLRCYFGVIFRDSTVWFQKP